MNVLSAAQTRNEAERRPARAAQNLLNDRSRRWAGLIDRIARGEADALGALYDESSSLTFGLILHILEDRDAAEDALVEAYVQVRDLGRSKTPKDDAVSWLLGLARGVALARRLRSGQSREPDACPPLAAAPASSVTPFEPLRRERQHITSALDQLTPQQRAIVQMTHSGGLTVNVVAAELKLSPQEVMTELRRALLTLRGSLGWIQAD